LEASTLGGEFTLSIFLSNHLTPLTSKIFSEMPIIVVLYAFWVVFSAMAAI